MRWLVPLALVLAACTSTGSDAGCPGPQSGASGDVLEGSPCAQDGKVCFVENTFSTCASGYYRCEAGRWTYDHGLGASEGASCADSPLDACSTEGNPSCDANPTSESCGCGDDGRWHCSCACYGGLTTCPLECPPEFPGVGTMGPLCASPGATCTYPDHACTCDSDGHFHCT